VSDILDEESEYCFNVGVNMLRGEIDSGAFGISYLISMYDSIDRETLFLPHIAVVDDETVQLSDLTQKACYIDCSYDLFNTEKTVKTLVEDGLEKYNLPYSSEDMFAFQFSYSSPDAIVTSNDVYGATFSVGVFMMQTDLESVENLEGAATNRGVNVPIGSYDLVNNDKDETVGFSVGLGPGLAADYHINNTETATIGSPLKSLIKLIKDWLGI
jgi:hypothetical protein